MECLWQFFESDYKLELWYKINRMPTQFRIIFNYIFDNSHNQGQILSKEIIRVGCHSSWTSQEVVVWELDVTKLNVAKLNVAGCPGTWMSWDLSVRGPGCPGTECPGTVCPEPECLWVGYMSVGTDPDPGLKRLTHLVSFAGLFHLRDSRETFS